MTPPTNLPQRPQRAHIRDTRTPHPHFGSATNELKALVHNLSNENRRLRGMLDESVHMVGDANDDLMQREWRLLVGEGVEGGGGWKEKRRSSV